MRNKIIAGNWKMNGNANSIESLLAGIKSTSTAINDTEIVVCPPAIYLAQVSQELKNSAITYGAQDVSDAESGAFTGEISASMLNDFACKYAIVGHSERRNGRGESSQLIAQKFQTAQQYNLIPILCVGELFSHREAGETEKIVAAQLDAVIDLCGVNVLANSIIAYEPVWAIGTGVTATPDQAQNVHKFIRDKIGSLNQKVAENLIIQYGGSMNANNAEELLSMPDIDGGLIGGASLTANDFMEIINTAEILNI